MSAEFDQLVKQFENFQSKIKRVGNPLERIGKMQEELTELTATATSPGRTVTVVAGPGGSVREITLTDAALRQPPAALAAELMATLQQAVAAAARKQASIVEAHMGGDLHVVDQVLESQAAAFGTSVDELRATLGEDTAPATPADEYEDFGQRSIMTSAPRPPEPPSSGGSAAEAFLSNLFDDEEGYS